MYNLWCIDNIISFDYYDYPGNICPNGEELSRRDLKEVYMSKEYEFP